jgi:hypothetical protein
MADNVPQQFVVPPLREEKETAVADDVRSTHSSIDDHIFKDEATAKYWRNVYDKAQYEGRHRFDPNYTWTEKEEKKLVRKVCTMPSC